MTFDEAVQAAFGRTDCLRRKPWPEGSTGVLDPLRPNGPNPFLFTLRRGTHMVPSHAVDLEADDWYPCTSNAEPAVTDWRPILAVEEDSETQLIERGDTCTVMLDGHVPSGDCTLVWLMPNFLTLRVPHERVDVWPSNGPNRLTFPIPRLSLLSNGIKVAFRVHSLDYKRRLDDGDWLYRLRVTQAESDK